MAILIDWRQCDSVCAGPLPHSQQPHIHPGLSSPPGSGGYEDWKEGRDSHDEHHSNRMG